MLRPFVQRRNMIADQQYNEVKAYNAQLRYKIDNMRREKVGRHLHLSARYLSA